MLLVKLARAMLSIVRTTNAVKQEIDAPTLFPRKPDPFVIDFLRVLVPESLPETVSPKENEMLPFLEKQKLHRHDPHRTGFMGSA